MLRKPSFATAFVTIFLLVYYLLFDAGASRNIIAAMFFISPLLVVWMVITILKHGKYNGKDLKEHEEWGYQDKDSNSLGMF